MKEQNNQNFEKQETKEEIISTKSNSKKPIPKTAIIIGAVAVFVIAITIALIVLLGGNNDGNGNNDAGTSSHTHSYNEWETTKTATCTTEGKKERYCSCGEKQTATVAKKEHTYVNGICSICGENDFEADAHTFADQICTKCGAYDSNKGLIFEMNSDNKSYTLTSLGTCKDSTIYIDLYKNLPVTHINSEAFSNCMTLKELYIGDSVIDIVVENQYDCYEFFGCSNLETVVLGDGLTEIEYGLFADCEKLKNVTLGNNIRIIGDDAFCGTAITEIVFPDKLMYIGSCAFDECDSLKTVTFGKEFCGGLYFGYEEISLGDCLPMYYMGTWGIENIIIHPDNEKFEVINNCVIEKVSKKLVFMCRTTIIPNGVEIIDSGTIGWLYRENVVIPKSVHTIEADKINCNSYLYMGNYDEWNTIEIDNYYELDSNIQDINNVYFYSETQPTIDGNFWRYVNGIPTIWE